LNLSDHQLAADFFGDFPTYFDIAFSLHCLDDYTIDKDDGDDRDGDPAESDIINATCFRRWRDR
jgi:hypothetical protein